MPTLDTILEERKLSPPLFYAISNRLLVREIPALDYLRRLFHTPAQIIQWREKDLSPEQNRSLVRAGSEFALKTGRVFLVNTDIELALEEGVDGAHLTSQQDLETAGRMREASGFQRFLLGKSAHSIPEVIHAERHGADYVLLAPIFEPISKRSCIPSLGLEALREAVASVSIPVFALGGITEENYRQAIDSGAVGVAGISWVNDHVRRRLRETGQKL